MSKKMMTICDLCGGIVERGYILEMREDLPQNSTGTMESWDVCPDCKGALLAFFRSKQQSDIPIINNSTVIL